MQSPLDARFMVSSEKVRCFCGEAMPHIRGGDAKSGVTLQQQKKQTNKHGADARNLSVF